MTTVPDRSNGVDDVLRRQPITASQARIAGCATAEGRTLCQQLASRGSMDCAIHPATAEQGLVGCVNNRIDLLQGNVALHRLNLQHALSCHRNGEWFEMRDESPDFQNLLNERLKDWTPDFVGTLLFVLQQHSVLLIRKQRGHGMGKINAPGGKLEVGETPLACALRETEEEVGIRALNPRLLGQFKFVDLSADQWFGYAYLAHEYTGTVRESEEAIPHWFPRDELPFEEMWEDDRYWLPPLLEGHAMEGEFLFDDGRLLTHRLRFIEPRVS